MAKFSRENLDESLASLLVELLCYTVYLATLLVTLKYNCDT